MCKEMNWADKDVEGSLKLLDSDGAKQILVSVSANNFLRLSNLKLLVGILFLSFVRPEGDGEIR